GDLAPAPWRRAEIDHAHPGPQEMVLVVDLGELEGGAAAIAPALRLLDIRIVELALEPAGRGELAPLGSADPDRQLAASALPCAALPFSRPRHALNPPTFGLALDARAALPPLRIIARQTPATCHAISSPSSSLSPCSWSRWIRR